jgi:CheY-like chemotaxis protein
MKTVLLVEDDHDDIELMRRACKAADIAHLLNVVTDGDAAIEYLGGTKPYNDRLRYPLPQLIFLDVKMPKRDGHQVLQWIRDQVQFRHLPVIMLTGSKELSDINRAYQLGVTSYLLKTAYSKEFTDGVRIILKYWLEMNQTMT